MAYEEEIEGPPPNEDDGGGRGRGRGTSGGSADNYDDNPECSCRFIQRVHFKGTITITI